MSRLDAKFMAQMNKDRKNADNVDAKKFLKSLGYFMPPEEELAELRKAIIGNDMDLEKVYARSPEGQQSL